MNELKCPQCGGSRLTPSVDGYYKCQYCRIVFKPESKTSAADEKTEQPQQPVVVNVSVPNTQPQVVIQQKSDFGGCVKKGCGILLILFVIYVVGFFIIMGAAFGF